MTAVLPPAADPWAAASHRAMTAHLAGPLAAAVRDEPLPLRIVGDDLVTTVPAGAGHLAVVAPAGDLDAAGLTVTGVVGRAGGRAPLAPVRFAGWTAAGSYRPLLPAGDPTEAVLTLRVSRTGPDTAPQPLPAAVAAPLLQVRLLGGVLTRLSYLLGAEKQHLRRWARQLGAGRGRATATGPALDRTGTDLWVPRLAERITFGPDGVPRASPGPEPDPGYRTRLGIYRRWLLPSPGGIGELLNGPGPAGTPPGGPLADAGLTAQLAVTECGNPLAVATALVEVPGQHGDRAAVLAQVRAAHLVHPATDDESNRVHRARLLSAGQHAADEALRAACRSTLTWVDQAETRPALAPGLAVALVRLARCRSALGGGGTVVRRVQDNTGGSRFELGLGADLAPIDADELAALAAAAADPPAVPDPGLAALLRNLVPIADDPAGGWLLTACGLRTAHRRAADRLYVSHLPCHGMSITPDGDAYRVRYDFFGGRLHQSLGAALADAERDWSAAGHLPWRTVHRSWWERAIAVGADDPVVTGCAAAGLPAPPDPADTVPTLAGLPDDLVVTVVLPATVTGPIFDTGAAATDAVAAVRRLVDSLRDRYVTAALPLVLGGDERALALLVAVTELPWAGPNLNRRRAFGYRWFVAPVGVGAGDGTLEPDPRTGPLTRLAVTGIPPGGGLAVLGAIGYARTDPVDPYEYGIGVPDGTSLTGYQYEMLMNILDRAHPAGIAVDTAALRRRHVDLDGDGRVEPLTPAQSRAYRDYRPGRGRAAGTIFGPDTPGLRIGVHSTVGVDTYLKP